MLNHTIPTLQKGYYLRRNSKIQKKNCSSQQDLLPIRYKRNCSSQQDLLPNLMTLNTHFSNRGYNPTRTQKIIDDTLNKLYTLPRTEEYFSNLPLTLEDPDPQLSMIYPSNILMSNQNKRSIYKKLIRTALPNDLQKTEISRPDRIYTLPLLVNPCHKTQCGTCPIILCKNAITSSNLYLKLPITERFTCDSKKL